MYMDVDDSDTLRWASLSLVLWGSLFRTGATGAAPALLIKDVERERKREAAEAAVLSFLDLLEWRVDGRVSPLEFAALYTEWTKIEHAPVPLDVFRDFLRQRRHDEASLDTCVALLLHQAGLHVLGAAAVMVDAPWLALAEEVYFSLDVRGHGHLGRDEVTFLAACLCVGDTGPHAVAAAAAASGSPHQFSLRVAATAAQLTAALGGGNTPLSLIDPVMPAADTRAPPALVTLPALQVRHVALAWVSHLGS